MKAKQTEQKLTIRFPFDLLDELRKIAREHQRSLNGEIIWALLQYVAQQKGKQS